MTVAAAPGAPAGADREPLPPTGGEVDLLARFDRVVDGAFDHVRGNPGLHAVAAVVSNLADYGFIWAVAAAAKGRHRGPARSRAARSLAVAGVTSAGVNRLVKEVVRRERPVARTLPEQSDRAGTRSAVPVRPPRSSSFPSGHTLAAFCTAIVLADRPAETAAYVGFATAVAVSRVHLRAHHPSDVLGGALIGSAAGLVVRSLRE